MLDRGGFPKQTKITTTYDRSSERRLLDMTESIKRTLPSVSKGT
jgi:hypothetical protein